MLKPQFAEQNVVDKHQCMKIAKKCRLEYNKPCVKVKDNFATNVE
jgi:hypothetical protein